MIPREQVERTCLEMIFTILRLFSPDCLLSQTKNRCIAIKTAKGFNVAVCWINNALLCDSGGQWAVALGYGQCPGEPATPGIPDRMSQCGGGSRKSIPLQPS